MPPPLSRSPRPRWPVLAPAVVLLLAGALLPWFSSALGTPVSAPLPGRLVPVVGALLALVLAVRRPGLAWVPALLAVAVGVGTLLLTGPGTTCWDGVDGAGRPVGGCETDVRAAGSWVFAAGLALLAVGTAVVVGSALAVGRRWRPTR